MQKLKTLIVDDERLARSEMQNLLKGFKELDIIAEAKNGEEAIELIEELKPDLVFLDIQMPGLNGFEVLEHISVTPDVIFVTAYDEYAIKAFEVSAMDYILKPVDLNRLKQSVEHSLLKHQEKLSKNHKVRDKIFIKDGEKCFFVDLKEVRLFESEGNYIRLYFNNSRPLVLKSLNNLEKRLDENTFFRASRKHIINLNWIEKIENWFNGGLRATLTTGEKVDISRRQALKFKDLTAL